MAILYALKLSKKMIVSGRRLVALALAMVGAVLVAAVVLQDGAQTPGREELSQAALGSWARDHSADPSAYCWRMVDVVARPAAR